VYPLEVGRQRKTLIRALILPARKLSQSRSIRYGSRREETSAKSMPAQPTKLIQIVAAAMLWALPRVAFATAEPGRDGQPDPAPCVAAAAANEDADILSICGALIDNDHTVKADRIMALVARAGVFQRKEMIERAIGDYDTALRLDPTRADLLNARGELWRKKGDRPKALQDFDAAIKLKPDYIAARDNHRSLALELERLGALMAIDNKPSFDCKTARRAVEKAICASPELANLDREIHAVNVRVVREATSGSARAGRALQLEQDEFIARRNAGFGRPNYDLQKAMRERLDQLQAIARH
jgi:tetratricopeptide (TPR) repeat protein